MADNSACSWALVVSLAHVAKRWWGDGRTSHSLALAPMAHVGPLPPAATATTAPSLRPAWTDTPPTLLCTIFATPPPPFASS